MAFVIVEKGSSVDIGKVFQIGKDGLIIGRLAPGSKPDIPLMDDYISRNHAEVRFDGNCFLILDMKSRNGTEIDGQLLEPGKSYPLKDNAAIGLGIMNEVPRVILRFKEKDDTIPFQKKGDTSKPRPKPVRWLRIDDGKKEAWVDGKAILLPPKEYKLLLLLYRNAGNYCSRDEIISEVWSEVSDPGGVSDAAVDQLIHRIREKIEPNPSKPKRIVSKKGFGYLLEP